MTWIAYFIGAVAGAAFIAFTRELARGQPLQAGLSAVTVGLTAALVWSLSQ